MSNMRREVFWPSLVLIILALPVFALVVPRTRTTAPLPANESAKPKKVEVLSRTPSKKTKERVEGEIIAISPHGFEPVEITRPHKHFILVIDNPSGLSEINLRLDRERGNRLREVRVAREKRNWSDDLDLEPGRYVLSEANHPQWICHITITPDK